MNTLGYLLSQKLLQLKPRDRWSLTWQGAPLFPGPPWKVYKEHASARFHCPDCNHSWHSAYVTLFFYMTLGKRRRRGGKVGTVSGFILRQYCKCCSEGSGVPGTPNFEDDDIAIILYNFLIHIRWQCYGEYVDDKLLQVPLRGSTHGRHRSDLCEACRLGVCPWTSPKRRPAGHAGRKQPWRYKSKGNVGNSNSEYHVWRPAGIAGTQQPSQHESKDHVEITVEPVTTESEGKPNSKLHLWSCCECITFLIALWVLFVVCLLLA